MVKGLEEGQRQKVSLPNLCCASVRQPRTVFGPFHPSASFHPLVFSARLEAWLEAWLVV